MRLTHHDPQAIVENHTLAIQNGGTGANNQQDAVDNLGGIWKGSIDQPGGFASIDENGLVKAELIPNNVSFGIPVNIKGPLGIHLDVESTYTITNYDSFTEYVLSFDGCTGYRDGETIIIRATRRGSVSFTINGSIFLIEILGNRPTDNNILGGAKIGDITPTFPSTNLGTCLRYTDAEQIYIGSPGYSSDTSSQVGRIDLVDVDGVKKKTIIGEASALTFDVTMLLGSLSVTTDKEPTPEVVNVSRPLVIPASVSSIRLIGSGAPGQTNWKPEVLGTEVLAWNAAIAPEKFKILVESVKVGLLNITTTTYNTSFLMKTDISKNDVHVDVLESHTASSDQNVSTTKMNLRAGPNQTTLEILNGPVAYDTLRLTVQGEDGQTVGSSVTLTFVSTNSLTGYSTYIVTGLYRTREGYKAGEFIHTTGADTKVTGYSRSLVWKGGVGSPLGLPMPRINSTAFDEEFAMVVQFKYNTHGLSSAPSVLSSPVSPGTGILSQIKPNFGRDTIDREVQWTLRNQSTGAAIRTANGEIKVEFLSDRIRITPVFSGVVWQNPPTSASIVLEDRRTSSVTRTEFAMTQVATDTGIIFEVEGLNYQASGRLDSSYQEAETSTKVIETTANNRFGEFFDYAPLANILVVGIRKDALSAKGALLIYENPNEPTSPVTRLDVVATGSGSFDLASVAITEEANFVYGGYPGVDKGLVCVYRYFNSRFELAIELKSTLATGARFGASVHATPLGKRFVVGAPGTNQVVVFDHDLTFTQKAIITAPGGYTNFGRHVRVSGDGKTLAVSTVNPQGRGVVLIYDLNVAVPVLRATIQQPTSITANIDFGITFDLSLNGGVIAVGAPGQSSTIGRVFLFFNGTVNWEHYKTLGEDVASIGAYYGKGIALKQDGTRMAVGAPSEQHTNDRVGSIHLYGGAFSFLS